MEPLEQPRLRRTEQQQSLRTAGRQAPPLLQILQWLPSSWSKSQSAFPGHKALHDPTLTAILLPSHHPKTASVSLPTLLQCLIHATILQEGAIDAEGVKGVRYHSRLSGLGDQARYQDRQVVEVRSIRPQAGGQQREPNAHSGSTSPAVGSSDGHVLAGVDMRVTSEGPVTPIMVSSGRKAENGQCREGSTELREATVAMISLVLVLRVMLLSPSEGHFYRIAAGDMWGPWKLWGGL